MIEFIVISLALIYMAGAALYGWALIMGPKLVGRSFPPLWSALLILGWPICLPLAVVMHLIRTPRDVSPLRIYRVAAEVDGGIAENVCVWIENRGYRGVEVQLTVWARDRNRGQVGPVRYPPLCLSPMGVQKFMPIPIGMPADRDLEVAVELSCDGRPAERLPYRYNPEGDPQFVPDPSVTVGWAW